MHDVVDFDLGDLDTVDPYSRFDEIRDCGPVVRLASGFWCVTGYQAALDVMRDPAATSGPIALRYLDGLPPGAARDEMGHRINFLDPPDHPRVRGLISKAFTPRRIAEVRPFAERSAGAILDRLDGRDVTESVDIVADYAHQIPSLVISEMLGVPPDDRDRLTGLSDDVAPLLGVSVDPAERARAIDAAEEMHVALGLLLDERRESPRDDLLSALLTAEEDGERLTRPELLSLAATLYSAGHRTTRDLFSNGLSVLLSQRRWWDWLTERSSDFDTRLAATTQEFLRYETPTLFVGRVPDRPITIAGEEIGPLEPILVFLAAANRDPEIFDEPHRFDPTRWLGEPDDQSRGPLSFAFGAHYCLGASLAKTEADVMLRAIVERWPAMRLADEPLRWHQRGPFRGLDELAVLRG